MKYSHICKTQIKHKVINHSGPTRGSITSRITDSLSLFYLLNHTLNFQNWRLICVLQTCIKCAILTYNLMTLQAISL